MKCPACDGEMDFVGYDEGDEIWECDECGETERR